MKPTIQNFNKIFKDKFERNKIIDDIKKIIKAVDALDLTVKKITIKIGMKIGTIELLNVYFLFNDKLRDNNNIKLNLASSEGWKVNPKIVIHLLASIGLLKSSYTKEGVNIAQSNNKSEVTNKIKEKLVKYL